MGLQNPILGPTGHSTARETWGKSQVITTFTIYFAILLLNDGSLCEDSSELQL